MELLLPDSITFVIRAHRHSSEFRASSGRVSQGKEVRENAVEYNKGGSCRGELHSDTSGGAFADGRILRAPHPKVTENPRIRNWIEKGSATQC